MILNIEYKIQLTTMWMILIIQITIILIKIHFQILIITFKIITLLTRKLRLLIILLQNQINLFLLFKDNNNHLINLPREIIFLEEQVILLLSILNLKIILVQALLKNHPILLQISQILLCQEVQIIKVIFHRFFKFILIIIQIVGQVEV